MSNTKQYYIKNKPFIDWADKFPMPTQNPWSRIGNEMSNHITGEKMDEDEHEAGDEVANGVSESDDTSMRDVITVECQYLNGKKFIGTVTFSEAKTKIFKEGLGLDADLLETLKIGFNKCPVINFKLKSKINVRKSIKNQQMNFTRTYHSKGEFKTDTFKVKCKQLLL